MSTSRLLVTTLALATLLAGCGHNPIYDDPEGVTRHIVEWARSQEK